MCELTLMQSGSSTGCWEENISFLAFVLHTDLIQITTTCKLCFVQKVFYTVVYLELFNFPD